MRPTTDSLWDLWLSKTCCWVALLLPLSLSEFAWSVSSSNFDYDTYYNLESSNSFEPMTYDDFDMCIKLWNLFDLFSLSLLRYSKLFYLSNSSGFIPYSRNLMLSWDFFYGYKRSFITILTWNFSSSSSNISFISLMDTLPFERCFSSSLCSLRYPLK